MSTNFQERAALSASAVYFISKGEVEVAVGNPRVKLKAGDIFGEMALLNHQPRSADVAALDYAEFLTLSQRDFRLVLRRYPEIREHVTALAEHREAMNRSASDYGTVSAATDHAPPAH